jgi:hypothetical protein
MLNSGLDSAPAELLAFLKAGQRPRRKAETREPVVTLDQDYNVQQAIAWLWNAAEVAEENNGGDSATSRVACGVRDFGISEAKCLDLMGEHWNDLKAVPPWDPDDLETKVRNAYRSASGVWGGASALAEFDAVEIDAGLSAPAISASPPALTLTEWLERDDLAEPDFLVGAWLHTTSRALIVGPTGLGKTNFGLALAVSSAAGVDFLHWRAARKARVLYIDGEMSRRLMRQRLRDAARRAGAQPSGLVILSREDCEDMPPLNTGAGQKFIDKFLTAHGPFDLVIFDNIQALCIGDLREETAWAPVLPWMKDLTKRSIGQMWFHHTGHDETKGYGSKAKEWQLDTVIMMERVESDMDLAFALKFTKARERMPDNRNDFAQVTMRLRNDVWEHEIKNGKTAEQATRESFIKDIVVALDGQTMPVTDLARTLISTDQLYAGDKENTLTRRIKRLFECGEPPTNLVMQEENWPGKTKEVHTIYAVIGQSDIQLDTCPI